jgi:hypothetical protein
MRLFLAGWGRGVVTLALADPVFDVNPLKIQEELAQFLYVVENPPPEQAFFEGAHQTPGTIPLPPEAP